MAANRRVVRLCPSACDAPGLRRLFEQTLRLPAVGQDATSVRYDAGDVIVTLDWSFDCRVTSAGPGDGVVLVDERDTVRALLDRLAVRDFPYELVELSDECLMWPSVGWRTGPR